MNVSHAFLDIPHMTCDTRRIMARLAAVATTVIKQLRIPENLYDHYLGTAAKRGRDVEDEIIARLTVCKDHDAQSAIYLDDAARRELTDITGKLIRNSDDLLAWARQVSAIKVEQVDVRLGQTLATRLSTRTFGHSWADYIRSTVIRLLEQEVGLR